jgi:Reeler domain
VFEVRSKFRVLLSLCLLFASFEVTAFSGGAPVCTIDTATMNANMGVRSGLNPNGWSITTQTPTYFPGQSTFDVQLKHYISDTQRDATFKGLLLWATDSTGTQVGTWDAPAAGFKYVANCGNSSITHASADVKESSPSPTFKLVLPITVRGQITINAFVVQSTRTRHYEMVSAHVHTDPLRNDLDVDSSVGTTKYHALTDGVLVMRYLLGLTGAALTRDAKSPAAIRTDGEIETQLASLRDLGKLDVDGNAQTRPETDGLLILRYLLGYRGSGLIQGANGGTLTASQIEANIALLIP